MDWNSSPELREMRQAFIDSFKERRALLAPILTGPMDLKCLQHVAHKLAGAAETYGFPTLSEIGGAIDDLLDMRGEKIAKEDALNFARLLDESMKVAQNGEDPAHLKQDTSFAKLIAQTKIEP
jgi:HPt (histidine-containing phosphotransfer) domain-containing protein